MRVQIKHSWHSRPDLCFRLGIVQNILVFPKNTMAPTPTIKLHNGLALGQNIIPCLIQ